MNNVIGSRANHPCISCNQYANGCRKGCYALLEYKIFDDVEIDKNKVKVGGGKQFSRAYLSPRDKKLNKKLGVKTFTVSNKYGHSWMK